MPQNGGPALVGGLCGLGVALAFVSLIGGFLLQLAISFYNALAGGQSSSRGVPYPDYGKATVIAFVNLLIYFFVVVAVVLAAFAGAVTGGAQADTRKQAMAMLPAVTIAYPLSLFLMAGVLSAMLPTTLGRALLVMLCFLVVRMLVSAGLGFAVALIGVQPGGR